MSEKNTPTAPHLPWLDLWQYSAELPLVMAGPFGPLLSMAMPATDWTKLVSSYAQLPATLASALQKPDDPA